MFNFFRRNRKATQSVANRESADLQQWIKAQAKLNDQYTKELRGRKDGSKLLKWMHSIIEIHIQLAKTVQREQFLEGETRRLMMSMGPENKRELEDLDDELKALNRKYWRLEKELYILEENCLMQSLRRVYGSLHSQHGWHLISQWLRNDCIRRGGCCGRSCQCCEKPPGSNRLKGWGHCTLECACCNRFRGFKLTAEEESLFQPDFDCEHWDKSPYSHSLLRAYMWSFEE
jgi:hypothetical protein